MVMSYFHSSRGSHHSMGVDQPVGYLRTEKRNRGEPTLLCRPTLGVNLITPGPLLPVRLQYQKTKITTEEEK